MPGSIPAHAAEPPDQPRPLNLDQVYPRACGGTRALGYSGGGKSGLSPRMRGNLKTFRAALGVDGSIPAHAGEPRGLRYPSCGRVYPRACGGTPDRLHPGSGPPGLSPRMRGNHAHIVDPVEDLGSIPAHAGEPTSCCPRISSTRGLSPRMRGNQSIRARLDCIGGSIPAHAGEPQGRDGPVGLCPAHA